MNDLPFHICELSARRLTAFKNFLNASGAEIFSSSNAYEVLRFRGAGETCVIYRNGKGELKYVGPVRLAWNAFTNNSPFRFGKKDRHPGYSEHEQIIATLVARDGRACFYCPDPLPAGLETIEYLLPLASGGPAHLANAVIAHRACNEKAGQKSLFEKIRLRDTLRAPLTRRPRRRA